jgi:RecB family exonuclease
MKNPVLSELRKNPHWSFSSLNGLLNICSLQWAFKYVYKKESESTPINLIFGSAFHRVAEWIAACRMENESPKAEEVKDAFAEAWLWQVRNADQLSLSDKEFEQHNATGQRMIECLNREWTEADIVEISKPFSVNLPGASKPLIGEIDLIVKDPQNKTILVDWKTAARKWPAEKANKDLQATCFMYAYEQITPGFKAEENLFRYDVVTKTKEPSYTQYSPMRSGDDFLRLSQLVQTAEKLIASEAFLPNEQGFYCGGCQHVSACKEWHRKARRISIPMKSAA